MDGAFGTWLTSSTQLNVVTLSDSVRGVYNWDFTLWHGSFTNSPALHAACTGPVAMEDHSNNMDHWYFDFNSLQFPSLSTLG
jgi:hypothetical protein